MAQEELREWTAPVTVGLNRAQAEACKMRGNR